MKLEANLGGNGLVAFIFLVLMSLFPRSGINSLTPYIFPY